MIVDDWHLSVYPRPSGRHDTKSIEINGIQIDSLCLKTSDFVDTFPCTFEEVFQALDSFDGLHIELDGAFAFRNVDQDRPWQIDGLVFEKDNRVWHLQLKGFCDRHSFEKIMSVCHWPKTDFIVQSITTGTVVASDQFFQLNWS
jgi:hypothetical protein